MPIMPSSKWAIQAIDVLKTRNPEAVFEKAPYVLHDLSVLFDKHAEELIQNLGCCKKTPPRPSVEIELV